MPRQFLSNEEVRRWQDGVNRTAEGRQDRQPVDANWSEYHRTTNQPSNRGGDRGVSNLGGPRSPPQPLYSRDRVNLHPGAGGLADLVTDSSGRRERYVIDGFGDRVTWTEGPEDHECSSYESDERPGMVEGESGRRLPQREWDTEHATDWSSDESERKPQAWSEEDDDLDLEVPRARNEHRVGPAYSDRQRPRRGGRFGNGIGERPPHLESRAGRRRSGSDRDRRISR